jgi:hypothetical protein
MKVSIAAVLFFLVLSTTNSPAISQTTNSSGSRYSRWEYTTIVREMLWVERIPLLGGSYWTDWKTIINDKEVQKISITDVLNALGDEGWELVSTNKFEQQREGFTSEHRIYLFFKRRAK